MKFRTSVCQAEQLRSAFHSVRWIGFSNQHRSPRTHPDYSTGRPGAERSAATFRMERQSLLSRDDPTDRACPGTRYEHAYPSASTRLEPSRSTNVADRPIQPTSAVAAHD